MRMGKIISIDYDYAMMKKMMKLFKLIFKKKYHTSVMYTELFLSSEIFC